MEVSVIKIGNSRGIRFSKSIIERYNIRDTVEMILDKGHIIIKPISGPRRDWDRKILRNGNKAVSNHSCKPRPDHR